MPIEPGTFFGKLTKYPPDVRKVINDLALKEMRGFTVRGIRAQGEPRIDSGSSVHYDHNSSFGVPASVVETIPPLDPKKFESKAREILRGFARGR